MAKKYPTKTKPNQKKWGQQQSSIFEDNIAQLTEWREAYSVRTRRLHLCVLVLWLWEVVCRLPEAKPGHNQRQEMLHLPSVLSVIYSVAMVVQNSSVQLTNTRFNLRYMPGEAVHDLHGLYCLEQRTAQSRDLCQDKA